MGRGASLLALLVVSLLEMVLLWTIPESEGFDMTPLAKGLFYLILGGALGVAIWRWHRRSARPDSPRLRPWSQPLFFVVPIGLGIFLAIVVEGAFEAYYETPQYRVAYAAEHGIGRIAALERQVTFSQCRVHSYTTTYLLELAQAQNLIFVMEVQNYDGSYPGDGGLGTPLRHAFTLVTDQKRLPLSHSGRVLGVYQAPAGQHRLVLPANVPYTLAIYAEQPLLTPTGVLAGRHGYHQLFGEPFPAPEWARVQQEAKASTCNGRPMNINQDFLSDDIFIPGFRENIFADPASASPRLLYDRPNNGGGLEELLTVDVQPRERVPDGWVVVPYKTLVNQATGQRLSLYLAHDPRPPRCDSAAPTHGAGCDPLLQAFDAQAFYRELPGKTELSREERTNLGKLQAYFFIDPPLKLGSRYLNFNPHIHPEDIDAVGKIAEVIAQGSFYTAPLPVGGER